MHERWVFIKTDDDDSTILKNTLHSAISNYLEALDR